MKKIITVVVLIAIGVGALAIFLIFSDRSHESSISQPAPATTLNDIASSTVKGVGTLEDLMSRKEDLECVVTYEVAGIAPVTTTGTVFLSADRIRGDFLTRADGMEILSSTIVTDTTLYSWSEVEGDLYGVKVARDATGGDTLSAREAVPLRESVAYDCRAWKIVDASVFVPPSEVLFRDLAEVGTNSFEDGTIYESPEDVDACAPCRELDVDSERNTCAALLLCSL